MKNLLVMRHAKSDWSRPDQEDFDRPLNKRGRKDLPRVAGFLEACGAAPDLVLASAAVRAQETAVRLVEELEAGPQLVLDGRLYMAGPEALSEVLAATAGGAGTALVIAHNPGMEEWIARLTGARVRLPTAAVARVDLEAPGREGRLEGMLQWLVTPRLLRSLGW